MTRPANPPVRRASTRQVAAAADHLRSLRVQVQRLGTPEPDLAETAAAMAHAMGFSDHHVGRLLQRAGIVPPLRRTLTTETIERFIAEAGEARATYPDPRARTKGAKSAAVKTTAPNRADPRSTVAAWRASPEQLTAVRRTLASYQRWSRDPLQTTPTLAELTRELSMDLSFRESHVRRLLRQAHIGDPLGTTLGRSNVGTFLHAAAASTVTYPGPYPQRSPSETASAPAGSKRQQKMARVRATFRAHRAVLDDPGLIDSTLEELVAAVATVTGIPADRIAEAMRRAGVVEPQHETVSAGSVELVIAEAFNVPPASPEEWPVRVAAAVSPRQKPVYARFVGPDQLEALRLVMRSAREELDTEQEAPLHPAELARRVANTLTFTLEHAAELLEEAGIQEPLRRTLEARRIERLVKAAYTSSARYPVPDPVTEPIPAPAPATAPVPGAVAQRSEDPAPVPAVSPVAPVRGPGMDLTDDEALAAYVQRMTNRNAAPGAIPSSDRDSAARAGSSDPSRTDSAPKPTTHPPRSTAGRPQPQLQQQLQAERATSRRRAPTHPACRRLAEGWAKAAPAHRMADLYLALSELTSYRSTPQAQALAEIAADRFGIHSDATTGVRLNDRAAQLWRAGEGGVQLDHLSRLEQRVRGIFYDGHWDRVTAWDSSSGAMLLYTCTGPELRAAAQAALDYGDLTAPVMRRQAVGPMYEPAGAEDPALVLAVAAEQLGRQAARKLHPSTPRPRQERPEQPAATKPVTRAASAATWVQPVSGDWGELVIGRLDSSYARHTPGPRSRAATTVREFMRRAPGTPQNAPKTVKVQSHYRQGNGSGDPAPTATRVSGHRRLWR